MRKSSSAGCGREFYQIDVVDIFDMEMLRGDAIGTVCYSMALICAFVGRHSPRHLMSRTRHAKISIKRLHFFGKVSYCPACEMSCRLPPDSTISPSPFLLPGVLAGEGTGKGLGFTGRQDGDFAAALLQNSL